MPSNVCTRKSLANSLDGSGLNQISLPFESRISGPFCSGPRQWRDEDVAVSCMRRPFGHVHSDRHEVGTGVKAPDVPGVRTAVGLRQFGCCPVGVATVK